jgi:outer membrane murein-binding lipoprotein Lpp
MKKITVLALSVLFVFLMVGCQSTSKISELSIMNADYLKKIPHLANRIYVTKSGVSAEKMCEEVRNILISRNHMTIIFDKEKHLITTEAKDVGYATLQRMSFAIEDNGTDCQVVISTQWKSGSKAKGFAFPVTGYSLQPNWAMAQWEKNRLGIAMAESAAIAHDIDKGLVSYKIEPTDLAWYNRTRIQQKELANK